MASNRSSPLEALSAAARRTVAANAQALRRLAAQPSTIEGRAARVWDIPAKMDLSQQIADEEYARARGAHNDMGDAMRHARWSQRTAAGAGPVFAEVAGLAHEADNLGEAFGHNLKQFLHPERFSRPPPSMGQIASESVMDLRNNAEGRRGAIEGREIRRGSLQAAPGYVAPYDSLYDRPEGLTGVPRR